MGGSSLDMGLGLDGGCWGEESFGAVQSALRGATLLHCVPVNEA